MIHRSILIALSVFLAASPVLAAEESLNLDAVEAPAAPKSPHQSSTHGASPHSGGGHGPRIMGRVDLSAEYSPGSNTAGSRGFRANHFLMFLKVEASPAVSFMGEMLNQSFYHLTYKVAPFVSLKFGKILVPFGSSDYYHRYYGGVMGYGAAGVMFPIIWAEYGVNSEWRLGPVTLDAYTVNAIGSANAATNPSFTSTSDKKRQALGFRLSGNPVAKTRVMLSGYSTYWSPGNPLFLGGIDASTDYGLVDIPGLKQIRLAAGAAAGFVRNGIPDSYRTYGDYLQLSTNAVPFAELRARYGTYIDNSRVVSAANSQALSLGAYIPVDVMNLLAEYQFNYEEVNETKNDLVRFMLALDF